MVTIYKWEITISVYILIKKIVIWPWVVHISKDQQHIFTHDKPLHTTYLHIHDTQTATHAHGHTYMDTDTDIHTHRDRHTDYGYLSIFVSSMLTLWPPYVLLFQKWPHNHKEQIGVINLCLPENKLEVLTSYLHVLDLSATNP